MFFCLMEVRNEKSDQFGFGGLIFAFRRFGGACGRRRP
jgi:hypothetical protein